MEGRKVFLVMLVLAGSLLLLCGCGEEEQPPAPEPAPVESGENDSGGAGLGPEENESFCFDGTPIGNCSVNKPKFCDASGNLLDDAEACGCPEGTFKRGSECLEFCADGTPLGECSAEQPNYCNMSAELEERASLCGCPPGYDRDGEGCRNACDDGTPKRMCSEETPPYYCNEDYELVLNPILCGCFEWEFRISGECFDPTAREYVSGEAVRITEDVTVVVENAELLHCDDGSYIRVRLTVSNGGTESFSIAENEFKMYRDGRYRMFIGRPQGCSVSNIYKWGEVAAGSTRYGNVYFKIVGGTGDTYSVQISRLYCESLIKDFNITIIMDQ